MHLTPSNPDLTREQLINHVTAIFSSLPAPVMARLNDPNLAAPIKALAAYNVGDAKEIICVPCGLTSGNLCVLVIPEIVVVKEFLAINPAVASTALSFWRGNFLIWLRITGWQPANQSFDGGWWITDGVVPVVDVSPIALSDNCITQLDRKILNLRFEEINWPEQIHQIFLTQRIQAQYGNLLLLDSSNVKYALNCNAAAALLHARWGLCYDRFCDQFFCKFPNLNDKAMPVDHVRKIILDFLHHLSALKPSEFPVERITTDTAEKLLNLLKVLCLISRPSERESLITYVKTRLIRRDGASSTVAEIYGDYMSVCQATHALSYPKRTFQSILPAVMREEFSILKSHCVERATGDGSRSTSRNGFFGITIRDAKSEDAKEVKDSKDGQDVQDRSKLKPVVEEAGKVAT
jgi:hypothetical protein